MVWALVGLSGDTLETGLIPADRQPEITNLFDELGKVINHFRRSSDDGNIVDRAIVIASHITEAERAANVIQPSTTADIEPALLALGTPRPQARNHAL